MSFRGLQKFPETKKTPATATLAMGAMGAEVGSDWSSILVEGAKPEKSPSFCHCSYPKAPDPSYGNTRPS